MGSSVSEGSLTTVSTVEGGRAEMPCDISAPTLGDSVYLVLWYQKDSGTPIYRYFYRINYLFVVLSFCLSILLSSYLYVILATFRLPPSATRFTSYCGTKKILGLRYTGISIVHISLKAFVN
jgi:hypothetical protein